MNCSQCGVDFTPLHFNQTLCSEMCKTLAARGRRAEYKRTEKGAETEKRWRKSLAKKRTDRAYYTSERGRRVAVARNARLLDSNPYYLMRRRLHQRAEYKRLREELIALFGKCQCCGSTDRLTIDHITPMSVGGQHERGNIQLLCVSCNASKKQETIAYALPQVQ